MINRRKRNLDLSVYAEILRNSLSLHVTFIQYFQAFFPVLWSLEICASLIWFSFKEMDYLIIFLQMPLKATRKKKINIAEVPIRILVFATLALYFFWTQNALVGASAGWCKCSWLLFCTLKALVFLLNGLLKELRNNYMQVCFIAIRRTSRILLHHNHEELLWVVLCLHEERGFFLPKTSLVCEAIPEF